MVARRDSMPPSPARGPKSNTTLKAALSAIRKQRGLRALDVAKAMGLPLRSYEHFEAGVGQLNLERLFLFADVTDSDPYAILHAVQFGSADFARRCADNKLATILALALQDFDRDLGDRIARLEGAVLIGHFTAVFRDLADYADQRDATAAAWLARRDGRDPDEPGDAS